MSDFEFKKDDCPLVDIEYQRGYQQGKADRDKELAEHNVFCSNRPIEDIVLEAVESERERIIKELEELHKRYLNRYGIVGNHSLSAIRDAIEIARGGE